ncbi:MAG: aminoacetone oxidase family FAD-binding enzyme [Clostridia bacterium]|nr:aminoacetone oxidase family FAD-binding enzyme [Clostridia bacterium]
MKKLIIVGGGYSALVLGGALLENNFKDFLILERNDRVGKKILVTGNGRCNLTNDRLDLSFYHGGRTDFIEYALKKYDNASVERFFARRGLLLTRENGRVYPLSRVSASVLDALRLPLADYVVTGAFVKDIKKTGDCFLLKTADGQTYKTENVVLSCGGKSGQNLGTDGSSYRLAETLGHTITKLYPSLTFVLSSTFPKGLKGIKHFASVTLVDGDKPVKNSVGDFLITEKGVSGNSVFDLSSEISSTKKPLFSVDFLPEYKFALVVDALKNKRGFYPDVAAKNMLTGYVHSAFSEHVALRLGIHDMPLSSVDDNTIKSAVELVKNYPVKIDGVGGFEFSQVTHGGVDTRAVNKKTMESKLCRGLYFTGEILDVDGDCGGYNLQWAYSSAMVVSESFK